MLSMLIAGGAVVLLLPLSALLWAVLSSMWDRFEGPGMFVRFFGVLALVVTVVTAILVPSPGVALVVGLVVTGVIVVLFSALG